MIALVVTPADAREARLQVPLPARSRNRDRSSIGLKTARNGLNHQLICSGFLNDLNSIVSSSAFSRAIAEGWTVTSKGA